MLKLTLPVPNYLLACISLSQQRCLALLRVDRLISGCNTTSISLVFDVDPLTPTTHRVLGVTVAQYAKLYLSEC